MFLNEAGLKIIEDSPKAYRVTSIDIAEKLISYLVNIELLPNQYSALVSFITTIRPIDFENSVILPLINKGQHVIAADQMMDYVMISGKESSYLKKRRKQERDLYLLPMLIVNRG